MGRHKSYMIDNTKEGANEIDYTAVFRMVGHFRIVNERRSRKTTYLRFDRKRIRLIVFLIAFPDFVFHFIIILFHRTL